MEKIANQLKPWINSHGQVRTFSFSQPVNSVKQAVEVSGYAENSIVKTIIMHCEEKDISVTAILTAEDQVNKAKLVDGIFSSQWKMATHHKIYETTGFPVGGVPPVCLGDKVKKFIDPNVLDKDFVITGGGSTTSLLGLPLCLIFSDGAIVKKISKG